MEYTEYCPNCSQTVLVEEDTTRENLYVIKNNKGDVVQNCPKCLKKLIIIDGVMSVVEE